ncbi:type II toxin-antitoxin system PemK/MazF family toxin [candidate division CSSED10-310 bacterium]|uniref:Type II toxin-antitoxin system PemK/MazF family toxin n=1 Tax=candidate division CSSED10-310 bacterium TaxID=2855610 RepID=A0ABV6Z4X7_UNCC1
MQNDIGNEKALTTIVAAISSSVRLFPMNVKVDPPEGGLDKPSIVKTSQILTVDQTRLETRLGVLKTETMIKVEKALKLSLAIPC